MRWKLTTFASIFLTMAAMSAPAFAQEYPKRVVTLVVPVPAGSGSDVVARLVARGMSEQLGQAVIVRNQDGAGGIIGAAAVAHSTPDGYTLLMTAGGQAILPSTESNLPFDVVTDFTPVSLLTSGPILLAANKDFPPNSVQELISYAKARPKMVTFGNTGLATVPTLAMYLLSMAGGIELVPVGYRGGAPAMVDVAAGNIDLYFSSFAAAVPFIQSGKVKVLGLSSAKVPDFVKTNPAVADVKPIADQGIAGFDVALTYGIFAPAKTPRDIIARLESAIGEVMRSSEVRNVLAASGVEARYMNSEDYARYFQTEIKLWEQVVKSQKGAEK